MLQEQGRKEENIYPKNIRNKFNLIENVGTWNMANEIPHTINYELAFRSLKSKRAPFLARRGTIFHYRTGLELSNHFYSRWCGRLHLRFPNRGRDCFEKEVSRNVFNRCDLQLIKSSQPSCPHFVFCRVGPEKRMHREYKNTSKFGVSLKVCE